MKNIIHVTIPKSASTLQLEVIECARRTHPDWELKVWRDPIVADTEGFLLKKYWGKTNSGAQFADLLRLDVLYKFGGVYIDSDFKLIKRLDDLVQTFNFFIASEDGYHLTNAVIGARKGCPIIRYLIDELLDNEPDWSVSPNITTGPIFFSQHLKWRTEVSVLPRETFYPYRGYVGGKGTVHRHSCGEHLWVGSWLGTEESGGYAALESMCRSWISRLANSVKATVKTNLIRGFRAWHRLQSINPAPSSKSYQCSGELVVQTTHGFRIVVDGRDLSVTPELVFKGSYELPEENFVKRIVKGGDWVIDVGANVGSFSLVAAQCVGPFGRVFSFEPNPRPAKLMTKSLVMNWMHERVIQRPLAVAERSGTVNLTSVPECLGGAEIGKSDASQRKTIEALGVANAIVLEVASVRLDDEFPADLPVKVLKIDVEGHEDEVLAGAQRLLERRCIDFVVIELCREIAGSQWWKIVDQVKDVLSYGYAIATLTNDGTLVEQRDLPTAIRAGGRNIVLAAREQYMPARTRTQVATA
jgi:FkbM family methyltransferase